MNKADSCNRRWRHDLTPSTYMGHDLRMTMASRYARVFRFCMFLLTARSAEIRENENENENEDQNGLLRVYTGLGIGFHGYGFASRPLNDMSSSKVWNLQFSLASLLELMHNGIQTTSFGRLAQVFVMWKA
jgi:hypothetical protein